MFIYGYWLSHFLIRIIDIIDHRSGILVEPFTPRFRANPWAWRPFERPKPIFPLFRHSNIPVTQRGTAP
jgi:hypothetical protein